MYRRLRILTVIYAAVFLSSCLSGCGIFYRRHLIIKGSYFTPIIQGLISSNAESFAKPFTLVTMLDSKPCGARLAESVFWSDWQRHMIEAGNGFVFATSRADSSGLVYAAELDSVDAPVLVIESYEKSLPRLNNWQGITPFHLLIDSTGDLLGLWLPAFDQSESTLMLKSIDSLIAKHNDIISSDNSGKLSTRNETP